MINRHSRRTLLKVGGFGALVALTGCAAGSVPQYVAAIQAIGKQAVSVLPELLSAASALGVTVSAATQTQISGYITDIVNLAGGVGDATTAVQGQSVLTQIETYINTLAPIVVPIVTALSPAAGAALGLIVAALPAIELLVDMTATELTPLAQSLATSAPTPPASMRALGAADNSPAMRAKPYLQMLLAS